jgi:hypothetical protein
MLALVGICLYIGIAPLFGALVAGMVVGLSALGDWQIPLPTGLVSVFEATGGELSLVHVPEVTGKDNRTLQLKGR